MSETTTETGAHPSPTLREQIEARGIHRPFMGREFRAGGFSIADVLASRTSMGSYRPVELEACRLLMKMEAVARDGAEPEGLREFLNAKVARAREVKAENALTDAIAGGPLECMKAGAAYGMASGMEEAFRAVLAFLDNAAKEQATQP